jgi:hypothetical protein
MAENAAIIGRKLPLDPPRPHGKTRRPAGRRRDLSQAQFQGRFSASLGFIWRISVQYVFQVAAGGNWGQIRAEGDEPTQALRFFGLVSLAL